MSRLPRLYIPGLPQLVLQRGNNRMPVFVDEADFSQYRHHLREAAREAGVMLHAYVLMPDHAHLLITSPDERAAGNMMQRLGRRYVRWFNDRHFRSGTLWEGRYRCAVIEPVVWLLAASRYIELNPVRAGLVGSAEHYRWSSCRHHLGIEPDPLISDHSNYWALGNTPFDRQAAYRAILDNGVPPDELDKIRYAAHRGWLLGEAPKTASDTGGGRRLSPLPKGRPRKVTE